MTEAQAIPLIAIPDGGLANAGLSGAQLLWAEQHGFNGQRGRLLALPGADGAIGAWLFGLGAAAGRPPFVAGLAGAGLPEGTYRLEGDFGDLALATIAFRLGAYRFERYRDPRPAPVVITPESADAGEIARQVEAAVLTRDLINMPPNDLGPEALEQFARDFAAARGLSIAVTHGEALRTGFPLIHAVGRASAEHPRLIDLTWGDASHPRVTLVGKGVTFDTGGLDIKSASGMLLMKKDMGGAANVLGLAHAIVSARLPVRLRVLLPVVENAIAGNAFRPGDVLTARSGLRIEIGNTDAEGRLILADALSLADEEAPDLLVDLATLTGAARVALGPDLPPAYSTSEALVRDLADIGLAAEDPLWPMPLWSPYETLLSSRIADINNAASGGFAGSVTAALFLRRFVTRAANWVHLDIFGWAPDARPGRPVGGTDQGIRALYGLIRKRYPG